MPVATGAACVSLGEEAQRYPAAYDGILAGDPTADSIGLTVGRRLWEAIAIVKDPDHCIPANKIPAVAAAASRPATLKQWVEHGKTPYRIVARHPSDGITDRSRPPCPNPRHAHWNGSGNTDPAENLSCGPA